MESSPAASASLRVGCSGWQYRHWKGNFYPRELSPGGWFELYASRFDTVEVNNTFYRLPEEGTFEAWARRAPPGFLFAIKASRFLTHMKKLKDPVEPLERLFSRARRLGKKLGPVLYQLPPRWPLNLPRLEGFLDALPKGEMHVFEFREPSWYASQVFRLLERRGTALCLHDMPGSASPREAVGPFVYVRFHGSGSRYGGAYPEERLEDWAQWFGREIRGGRPAFAYFNNDVGGHAPRDALRLRAMTGDPFSPSPAEQAVGEESSAASRR